MHGKSLKAKGVVVVVMFLILFLHLNVIQLRIVEAQEGGFPNKPIEILCGYDPGSFMDVGARMVGEKVSKILKVPVVIQNRSGAHAKIALRTVVHAKPDGYPLMTANQANLVIARIMSPDYPIDPENDLMPIYEYGAMPSYATVNSSAPWKTLQDFIDDAKKHPDKFDVGTAGAGSTSHFILEILCTRSGAKIKHVPFKGGTALVTQILGGHLSAVFTGNPTLLNNIEAGKLRALAIFADDRDPRFPNVPTVAEAGYSDASLPVWAGFFGPQKMPEAVHGRLVSAFGTAIKDPEVMSALRKIGILIKPKGPEEITKHLKTQYPLLLEYAKKTNIVK